MWKRLSAIARWQRFYIWIAVVAVTGLVLCFIPLLNLLGYEFSLVIALVASFAAGHLAAAYPHRIREQLVPFPGARWTIIKTYGVTAGLGLALLALPLVLISLNALRVRNCDFVEGFGFFFLGPVCAVAAASAWGLVAGLVTPGQRSASVLWMVFWIGAIAHALYGIWTTPSVRALGTFHGYFSGVLYDEDVTIPVELLTFRLRDVFEVAAALSVCSWLIDRTSFRLSFKTVRKESKRIPLALVLVLIAAAGFAARSALGHRRTAEDVAHALGGRLVFDRCELIYPDTISDEDAQLFARDCAFRLDQVEAFFGLETGSVEHIRVYLFTDADEKQELMGAGHTSIAKPWRNEVYVQGFSFPHPVLKHEIAHVVAGTFAARPLHVSGALGGVLVSPGMIEGAAVAAAWSERELTPHAWSRAMHDLDVAPPLRDVMGLSFLGLNASRAYVLAGSFSRFLIDEHGVERYRKAYRTADLEGAYGRGIDELESEWVEFLSTIKLRPGDMDLARDRFVQPAVFGKVCAHEVAQLRTEADDCELRGAWREAVEARELVETYSGGDGRSRLELGGALLRLGDDGRASKLLRALSRDKALPGIYTRAAIGLEADRAWRKGRRSAALKLLKGLARQPGFENERRMLTVKLAALEDDRAEPFLKQFFVGGTVFGPESPDLGMLTLSEMIRADPDLAIGHYLLGRQLWMRDAFDRALPYFARAEELGLPTEPLRAANRFLTAISLFRTGELERARTIFSELADDEERPSGARATARDWVERCDWELERRAAGGS